MLCEVPIKIYVREYKYKHKHKYKHKYKHKHKYKIAAYLNAVVWSVDQIKWEGRIEIWSQGILQFLNHPHHQSFVVLKAKIFFSQQIV